MARPMLRATLLCALALLVAAPVASGASRTQILGDCQDNGRIDGQFSAGDLRDARANIPDDINEYSDCYAVLTRAMLAARPQSQSGGGDGGGQATAPDQGGGGGGSSGSSGSSGGGGSSGGDQASAAPDTAPVPLTPDSSAERQALDDAALGKDARVTVGGTPIVLSAGTASNGLPGSLVALLVVLAVAAALAAAAGTRTLTRRVRAHRQRP